MVLVLLVNVDTDAFFFFLFVTFSAWAEEAPRTEGGVDDGFGDGEEMSPYLRLSMES